VLFSLGIGHGGFRSDVVLGGRLFSAFFAGFEKQREYRTDERLRGGNAIGGKRG